MNINRGAVIFLGSKVCGWCLELDKIWDNRSNKSVAKILKKKWPNLQVRSYKTQENNYNNSIRQIFNTMPEYFPYIIYLKESLWRKVKSDIVLEEDEYDQVEVFGTERKNGKRVTHDTYSILNPPDFQTWLENIKEYKKESRIVESFETESPQDPPPKYCSMRLNSVKK